MFCEFDHKIFELKRAEFADAALELARLQYQDNAVYRAYADLLYTRPGETALVRQLPFLPISFFKTHRVVSGAFPDQVWFESSGTTGQVPSRHFIKDIGLYRESFLRGFRRFYGEPGDYCILGLLPSYLERQHSSLVFMVNDLIARSGHPDSAFYLYQWAELRTTLKKLEAAGQRSLLIGVTFALLEFAEQEPLKLEHTLVMETGGMKGRQAELTRGEVHERLKQAFGLETVHSEYGMTELLSQAYAPSNGRFFCPPWMQVLVREEDDPLSVRDAASLQPGEWTEGLINIIDLANRYSCAFVATDDIGRLHADGSFEILGRKDNSDLRGCSLLVAAHSQPASE